MGCSLLSGTPSRNSYIVSAFSGLRGERTTIHRNLCISLFLAELLLLSGLDAVSDPTLCGVIAGFLHFFFLATFFWMLVEGVHVYYMLVKVNCYKFTIEIFVDQFYK